MTLRCKWIDYSFIRGKKIATDIVSSYFFLREVYVVCAKSAVRSTEPNGEHGIRRPALRQGTPKLHI